MKINSQGQALVEWLVVASLGLFPLLGIGQLYLFHLQKTLCLDLLFKGTHQVRRMAGMDRAKESERSWPSRIRTQSGNILALSETSTGIRGEVECGKISESLEISFLEPES